MSTVTSNAWAVVLAAENGTAAATPMRDLEGNPVRPPLWAPRGGKTLLSRALDRAERAAPRHRIVTVVDADHRLSFEAAMSASAPRQLVIQPNARGTAPMLLLSLLHVHRHAPDSIVVVLPAHHHVEHEWTLQVAIHRALDSVAQGQTRLALLGMIAESAEPEHRWVVPAPARRGPLCSAASLHSRASSAEAHRLMAAGGLISSSIVIASTRELVRLFRFRLPQLSLVFEPLLHGELELDELAFLFDEIPALDFEDDLLPKALDSLSVLAVPPCGWNDLGTPERVAQLRDSAAAPFPSNPTAGGSNLWHRLAATERAMEGAAQRGPE